MLPCLLRLLLLLTPTGSTKRRSMFPRAFEPRLLRGTTGDSEWSRCGMYDTTGDPYEEDSDGGGTEG